MAEKNVAVVVRIRPPTGASPVVVRKAENAVEAPGAKEMQRFDFDGVLPTAASNVESFAVVSPLIEAALAGVNATVLAYGQTGSGKTHTLGSSALAACTAVAAVGAPLPDSAGVIQRACARLSVSPPRSCDEGAPRSTAAL